MRKCITLALRYSCVGQCHAGPSCHASVTAIFMAIRPMHDVMLSQGDCLRQANTTESTAPATSPSEPLHYECVCRPGYTGVDCSEAIPCPSDESGLVCAGRGVCHAQTEGAYCIHDMILMDACMCLLCLGTRTSSLVLILVLIGSSFSCLVCSVLFLVHIYAAGHLYLCVESLYILS